VVFAGVYAATETTAVPFLMVTTDRGDVRELLDTSGAGFAHYYYDAYGVQCGILGAATSNIPTATVTAIASRQPPRYASYTFDEQSGLYYCSQLARVTPPAYTVAPPRRRGSAHVDIVGCAPHAGATGFDATRSREEAGRGLLASLNRGTRRQASTIITLSLPK
jgi:hypothetical protein